MTHKQEHVKEQRRHPWKACVAMILSVTLLTSYKTPATYGFAADVLGSGLETHSSFHYELTRVLALYAGFDKHEAETIAVACEATDTVVFTGYAITTTEGTQEPVTVTVHNTERSSRNNLFYHFSRRSPTYQRVPRAGTKAHTCDYFTGDSKIPTKAPCTQKGPELDQIKNWAFGTPGVKPEESQIPEDESCKAIRSKTLVALGIYLHSTADSYSHEKCMLDAGLRSHPPAPFSCSPWWHIVPRGEFGFPSPGVRFTHTAALEVWRALKEYRGEARPTEPPKQVRDFINGFIGRTDGCERARYAVATFDRLAGEKTAITCSETTWPPPRNRRA
jgi:hypothetical protein